MTAAPVLGIIDWGIGGLGLLDRLDTVAPAVPVVYWSDAGSVPYGLQPSAGLAARLGAVVGELADRGCTEVVLACNAASTVVGRLGDAPVPVQGVIAPGIAAVPDDAAGVIGVVGGRRTIRGGAYRRALARPGRMITSRIAQPLSAHIEAGRTGTPEFAADLHRIVAPLRGASAVVLACTHYPAAGEWFAAELPGTLLVDPVDRLAADLAGRWGASAHGGKGSRTVVTTGDVDQMRASARAAWGMDLADVEPVSLLAP